MAVVADEPGIVVVLLNVVARQVVIEVALGRDLGCEVGHGDVRITLDPAIGDDPVIPVIPHHEMVVGERIGRRDGEDVADAGVIIDGESRAIVAPNQLQVLVAAGEVVVPGVDREEHPDPSVGVDPDHRHVGVAVGPDVHLGIFPPLVGLGAVQPDGDRGRVGCEVAGPGVPPG
jgi:hypothetical protein